ncbi:MAG TPA: C39 family peptidase [Vicinamibacterales bacterium]
MLLFSTPVAYAQDASPPVPLLDVPYISQTEALCGGAAAAMVLRYWGERGLSAESFEHLVDRSAAGIRTAALTAEIAARGWRVTPAAGDGRLARHELAQGRPVLALIQDRPGAFHYVVVVAWHDRGIVFHDPARAPFRVMRHEEFTRRWEAADSWMLVVVPAAGAAPASQANEVIGFTPTTAVGDQSCEQRIRAGVAAARANDLDAAERVLSAALACPGPAASRELAGVRLLQRRWPEVTELATAALEADPHDGYAWKLLGTSRFVQDDRRGALAAWNRVSEPRVDLVRIDGLTRTRHRVVEQLIGLRQGDLLTPGAFVRARRRLFALPSAASARLEFVPVPSGLAEIRGAVNERPLIPSGALAYAALGLSAAATRELRLAVGSISGGGEQIAFGWRVWRHRPRVGVVMRAPAPWGGVWSVDADWERQPFDTPAVPTSERSTVRASLSDWATGAMRWDVSGGFERRQHERGYGRMGGSLAVVSPGDRVEAHARTETWLGGARFGSGEVAVVARSSTERQGVVVVASGGIHGISATGPLDLWPAGDTGHARRTLLRAHPVLDSGRLRVNQLGRVLVNGSAEVQRWWPLRRFLMAGGALFLDAVRTASRLEASARHDVDVGGGARLAVSGISGFFRVDLAKGLRDGSTALSLTYVP